MIVRRFEAPTMRDAIQNVKRELGSDAVILGTKQLNVPGSTASMVEVRAAVASHDQNISGATVQTGISQDWTQVEAQLTEINERLDRFESLERGLRDIKLLLLESRSSSDLVDVSFSNLRDSARTVLQALDLAGIDKKFLLELAKIYSAIDFTKEFSPEVFATEIEFYRSQGIKWFLNKIKVAPSWQTSQGIPSVQVLIGNSGSGKSSVISKLASHFVGRHERKASLISVDDSSVAASENLKIISKIIGTHFQTADGIDDLSNKIMSLHTSDMIFIDTKSWDGKDGSSLGLLKKISEIPIPIDFHLVLNLCEKSITLDQMIRNYLPLGLKSLVFTRVDECLNFGDVFNLSSKWEIPLSYFSVGRSIPDDIERASRERVVERLFGL